MKILYVNSLYPPHIGGGAEITIQTQVEGMKRRGHDVSVLAIGPAASTEFVSEVPVTRHPIRNLYWPYASDKQPALKRLVWHLLDSQNPRMASVIKAEVTKIQPDLVSVHNLAGWSATTWSAIASTGTPVVQVLHDLYGICPNSFMFRAGASCRSQCVRCSLFRLRSPSLSRQIQAVVGVSQYVLDAHIKNGYFRGVPIQRAIHNARNMQLRPRPVSDFCKNGIVRFGYIGSLTAAKGLDILLDAFGALPADRCVLRIAGKGHADYITHLRAKSSSNTEFVGYVEPQSFFSTIDVLVVPSLWNEALGMVIPEAFCSGIPVVASDRGGIPEMIRNGENGFLFDPTIRDQLLRTLERFVIAPEQIAILSPAALETARRYIDIDSWLDKYEHLYKTICQKPYSTSAPGVLRGR